MAANDVDELSVAFRGPHGAKMSGCPDDDANEPKPQTKGDRCCQCAVGNRNRARRTAKQDRFGQRPVDGRVESRNGLIARPHNNAPPPNEKNDRKKLDAAKAIDKPNTI